LDRKTRKLFFAPAAMERVLSCIAHITPQRRDP